MVQWLARSPHNMVLGLDLRTFSMCLGGFSLGALVLCQNIQTSYYRYYIFQ